MNRISTSTNATAVGGGQSRRSAWQVPKTRPSIPFEIVGSEGNSSGDEQPISFGTSSFSNANAGWLDRKCGSSNSIFTQNMNRANSGGITSLGTRVPFSRIRTNNERSSDPIMARSVGRGTALRRNVLRIKKKRSENSREPVLSQGSSHSNNSKRIRKSKLVPKVSRHSDHSLLSDSSNTFEEYHRVVN